MKQPLLQTKKQSKAKTTCPEGPEPVVIKDERIDPIEDMSVVSIFPEEHCILTVEERHVLADYGPFIPTAFSRANFGPKKHQCLKDMSFVVGDVVYTIKYKFVKGRGCRVEPRTGWREFASANKLLKGDGVFLRRFNPGLKTFVVDIIRG